MEFVVESCFINVGVTLGYGSPKTLTDTSVRNCLGDIRELKPTIMVGVPSVWELIRKGIVAKVEAGGAITSNVFGAGMAVKKATSGSRILGPAVGAVVDNVIFKKVKEATGGRLRIAMNGGAPISRESQEFLHTSLVTLIQGYGLTESCG
jgi:long-chain acyl-CoA synthetase